MKRLILGGVRSGKSRLAERLAGESGLPVTYLATALPGDEEMRTRIRAHRVQRPDNWKLVEEPYRLAAALQQHAQPEHCLLVECLTLWLTNLLLDPDPERCEQEQQALLEILPKLPGEIILVGNETNMGVIPMGSLSRQFCDESGLLHQAVAALSDEVLLTVAGLPLKLKGKSN
jgi:adenosylcobinamide kinase / adenosylcobinamide-phosphate guanylyltransferase